MVWRSPALIVGVLGALLLCSCAPSAPSPTVDPIVQPSSRQPATFADGDYLLTVEPTTCSTPMNGHILTVSNGTATLPLPGVTKTGPVTVDGPAVSIELTGGNGGLQLLLDGTIAEDGTVTGPGKDTAGPGSGYDCDFAFTLSQPAPEDATPPDGDYILDVEPDCPTAMDGRTISIADGQATYPMASGFTMTGPVTSKAGAVDITLDLTEPSVITTTFDGTLYTNGAVVGTGQNGGIHPGGETGYACDFTFVMTPAPPAPPAPTAAPGVDCSQAALQAAVDATGRGADSAVSDTQFVCSGEWATAGITVHGGEAQVTGVFHVEDGTWVQKNRNDECTAGRIPADIAYLACNSN
ncbi:MAG: hypothetical protein ABWX82_07370 [Leifsonia sp.]